MASRVRVSGFEPSVNGLRFVNWFPSGQPDIVVDTPLGRIPVGDASKGVCGGMVFTARDVFETSGMVPLAQNVAPAGDDPLFHYIVGRLIDSFELSRAGFLKYYKWMVTPEEDVSWPPLFLRRGIAWKTIAEEWPTRIRPELDAGRLCSLGLVTTASSNPADLGMNHQVLAYGYDLSDQDELTLWVYDPNTPPTSGDSVHLSVSLSNPTKRSPISHNVGIAEPVRGFFGVHYEYRDPSALAPR